MNKVAQTDQLDLRKKFVMVPTDSVANNINNNYDCHECMVTEKVSHFYRWNKYSVINWHSHLKHNQSISHHKIVANTLTLHCKYK